MAVKVTSYEPGSAYAWVAAAPLAVAPSPKLQLSAKPAAVSAWLGSVAVPANEIGTPHSPVRSGPASAAGATFGTSTVAFATVACPVSSVTRTTTVRVSGPSSGVNATLAPGVSNVPSPSRSQPNVTGPSSGSAPDAVSVTAVPSAVAYGPPALATGASSSVMRTNAGA